MDIAGIILLVCLVAGLIWFFRSRYPDISELKARAGQGDPEAQFDLGCLYHKGKEAPKDVAEAEHWFRLAAEQGYAPAQNNLGFMYSDGNEASKDVAEAVHWYRLAAEQGLAGAQLNLGLMYATGEGVPEDFVQAYAWLNIAAAQGNEEAKRGKGILIERMTPVQMEKAQGLSGEYWDAYGPGREKEQAA